MTATAPATAIRSELQGVPESRVSPRSEFELREIPDGTGIQLEVHWLRHRHGR